MSNDVYYMLNSEGIKIGSFSAKKPKLKPMFPKPPISPRRHTNDDNPGRPLVLLRGATDRDDMPLVQRQGAKVVGAW